MAARLREGAADTVVMARDMTIRCPHGFDERFLLERLSDLYPSTWRFSVDSLVGASPEMLIAAACGTASSRVLAGTCKPSEGQALASSAKDLREHALTSESVSSILERLCLDVRAQGPFLLTLPNVTHLATDVRARLGSAHLLDLVAALHPTAAVCGTPRDAAWPPGLACAFCRGRHHAGFGPRLGVDRDRGQDAPAPGRPRGVTAARRALKLVALLRG